eukprot:6465285-Amphidinium_carterae.1
MGAKGKVLERLLKWKVIWQPSVRKLFVSAAALEESDSLETLRVLLLKAWRTKPFVESRWCSVGTSARSITLATALGYWDVIRHVRARGVISEYDVGAIDFLDHDCLSTLAVVGCIAHVTDTFLADVLQDSRLAMRSDTLNRLVAQSLDWLEGIQACTWKLLGGFVGFEASELRHKVIHGAHLSACFLHWRVFRVLNNYPWSLCGSDMETKLRALAREEEPPSENIAFKIWSLLRSKHDLQYIMSGVELLSTASFSTHFTERQHASAALVARVHPEYNHSTMQARAFIHSF